MSGVLPSLNDPARHRRAAAWGRGALLLGPLLLLAALGARGLWLSRGATRAQAEAEATRALESKLPVLLPQWALFRLQGLAPLPYDDPPVPPLPGKEHGFTPGGLPAQPLAEWARLAAEPPPADLADRATALGRAAVETHPSLLTPLLLAKAEDLLVSRGADPAPLRPYRDRWEREERARRARAKPGEGWKTTPEGTWWVDDAARLFSLADLQPWASEIQPVLAAGLPAWDELSMSLAGRTLAPASASGEVLATAVHDGLSLRVHLARPELLYAQQRQQTWWFAGLLLCAFTGSLAAFAAMQRALTRERQLGELKSDFVSSVSHELRAPVASMRLMAENLATGAVTAADRRAEYHHYLAEECARLSALIENVLDFSRIEQGREGYEFAETDLAAMARDTVLLLRPQADRRRQEIRLEVTPLEPPAVCDGLAVRQALLNLLDNALKFSPAGTAVTVRLAPRAEGGWLLAVEDEGPGIAPAEQEKIFERFYRIGSELRRETPGAGIGLAIVRHIVAAHGGGVLVRSAPGAGAVFTLHFPSCPAS